MPSTTSSELTTLSSLTTPCATSSTPQKTSQQRLSAATFFSFVPTSTAYLLLMAPSTPVSSSGFSTIFEHLEDALVEMGRIIGQKWILDIPIKNHILARARGLFHGETRQLSNWEPKTLTTDDVPFVNFHLAAVRRTLNEHGWDTTLAASANNFRRWDQVLPERAKAPVRPLIYGLEMVAQTLGKGWWGPSQFLWATRHEPLQPATISVPELNGFSSKPASELAARIACPVCHSTLQWSSEAAKCLQCSRTYPYNGSYWDFVPTKLRDQVHKNIFLCLWHALQRTPETQKYVFPLTISPFECYSVLAVST